MLNDISKQDIFINEVFKLMNEIEIDDIMVTDSINLIKDNIESMENINSWDYCNLMLDLSYNNRYDNKTLLNNLKLINKDIIKPFIKNLIKDSNVRIFYYGNIKKEDIPSFNFLKNNLSLPIAKNAKIKIKKYNKIKHSDNNTCIQISYFIGKFKPSVIINIYFIKLILEIVFFDEMRVNKKLGYLVTLSNGKIGNQYYIYQKIQSNYSSNKLINACEDFNNIIIDQIKKIDLKKIKETVINGVYEKEENTFDYFISYYNDLLNFYDDIINKKYFFNRKELFLKEVDKITIKSLIKFADKYIIHNKKKSILIIN